MGICLISSSFIFPFFGVHKIYYSCPQGINLTLCFLISNDLAVNTNLVLRALAVGKRYMSAAQTIFLCHTGQMADLTYSTPTDLLLRNKHLLIIYLSY